MAITDVGVPVGVEVVVGVKDAAGDEDTAGEGETDGKDAGCVECTDVAVVARIAGAVGPSVKPGREVAGDAQDVKPIARSINAARRRDRRSFIIILS